MYKLLNNKNVDIKQLNTLIEDAHNLSLQYESSSTCKSYLTERFSDPNCELRLLSKHSEIVGFALLDILGISFANLCIHCLHEEDEAAFVKLLHDTKFLNNMTAELIQFRSSFTIRDAFIELGITEKERVKMIHPDLSCFNTLTLASPLSLKAITQLDIELCGKISYKAHQKRFNDERYYNYATPQQRKIFSEELREFDSLIDEASCFLVYEKKAIGFVECIIMQFQDETIPWIADISILPKYQAQGFGQLLLQHALNKLYCLGYQKAGLSVTCANENAYHVYQKLGFEAQHYYVELLAYSE